MSGPHTGRRMYSRDRGNDRMSRKPELFIGVTSWNSQLFLPLCLRSINDMSAGIDKRVVVLDNASTDRSVELAQSEGCEVVVSACNQAQALNRLVSLSNAPFTLLIHADVVLLSRAWYDRCRSRINEKRILVSPEDIGCGPLTRPFGLGKPESSFLFFSTSEFRKTRFWNWRHTALRVSLPAREVDFFGDHITHNLPDRLARAGFDWFPMRVHVSDTLDRPIYVPRFVPPVWSAELGSLRYGLGNFYSIDGEITHYHNWYDRVDKSADVDSELTTGGPGRGFPSAYIRTYSEAFIRDYQNGQLVVPHPTISTRSPVAL